MIVVEVVDNIHILLYVNFGTTTLPLTYIFETDILAPKVVKNENRKQLFCLLEVLLDQKT